MSGISAVIESIGELNEEAAQELTNGKEEGEEE